MNKDDIKDVQVSEETKKTNDNSQEITLDNLDEVSGGAMVKPRKPRR